jgi:DNA ligase-1
MNSVSIIKDLSATTSRIDKEQILINAFMTGQREFFKGAQLAYDPLITFGVKKVALIEEADDEPGDYTFADFLALANDLRTRKLTGHAARDAINAAAMRCHVETWNMFYRRILLKDFKAGVEQSTINKILKKLASEDDAKDFIVPEFSCQLAEDGMKPVHHKKVSGRKMLDIKLDGMRLLTVLDKEQGTVNQYTRTGKLNENFSEIREGLLKLLPELKTSLVLDGEVISTSFQDLMTQVNRREGVDTKAARLALFDIIPLDAFRAGKWNVEQVLRQEILAEMETSGLFKKYCNGLVYVIPKVTVDLDTDAGQETFKEFNKQAIESDYEGIMVKDPKAPYICKRNVGWLKIKPFIEVSLEVIGIEEGEPDGKYKGKLGALKCQGEDDGKEIEVFVGSGISDIQRDLWWKNPALVMGMIVEVRADCFTLEAGGTVYSLRFPRLKGFRGTVPGEKL